MPEVMNCVLYVSSVLVLTELLFKIKQYFIKKSERSEQSSVVSMGLFFPDYSLCCPFVYRDDYHSKPLSFKAPEMHCSRSCCKYLHLSSDPKRESPLRRMIKVLSSATKSLDISLWVFSAQLLARVCIYLHKKKVFVRIVIDSREDETTNTQIADLRGAGIEVRFGPALVNSGMFHHKFAIVDSSTVLTGSMNWTISAVRKSSENVCVTSRPELVSAYVHQFNTYWNTFSALPTNVRRIPVINGRNVVNQ